MYFVRMSGKIVGMKLMNNIDLVSIVVITYNSSDTVLETLESIYKQTYSKLELIISDDCSSDNTIKIVRDWIKSRKKRFAYCGLSVSKKNGGVVYNCNKGLRRAKGKYIKEMSADDVLKDTYIENCVKYLKQHSVQLMYTKAQCFGNPRLCKEMERVLKNAYVVLGRQNQEEIKNFMLRETIAPTTSIFFTKELYEKMGGYDMRFPFWEDGPFLTKVVDQGIAIGFLDQVEIYYRNSSGSLGHAARHGIVTYVDYRFTQSKVRFFYMMKLWILLKNKMYEQAWNEHCIYFSDTVDLIQYHFDHKRKR